MCLLHANTTICAVLSVDAGVLSGEFEELELKLSENSCLYAPCLRPGRECGRALETYVY